MNKDNIFRSSEFHMDTGDVLHMIVIDESGAVASMSLYSTIDPNNSEVETVLDYDGNQYSYVTIGTQQWLLQNLKTTHYNDGTPIPNLTADGDWIADTTGAYCWYNNDVSFKTEYGAFYNWYAATNAHNLAPTGWQVPSYNDWVTLYTYLGGSTVAGGKMKEVGLAHWTNPNIGASNESGFTAIAGGERQASSANMGALAEWWCTNQGLFPTEGRAFLINHNDSFLAAASTELKFYGFNIRCMRDII